MNRSEARGIVYSTLSGCCGSPDEKRYRWIAEGEWLGPLQQAYGLLTEGGVDALPCWDAFVLENKEEAALEMMCDYRRLFIDAFPRTVPREVFRSHPGNDQPVPADILGIPDRIVYGFEFMGNMAKREAPLTGAEKIRMEEMQMDFFSRFLLPWVPSFCRRIVEGAQLPFYRCLGELSAQFIHFEKNYLGVTEEGDAPMGPSGNFHLNV